MFVNNSKFNILHFETNSFIIISVLNFVVNIDYRLIIAIRIRQLKVLSSFEANTFLEYVVPYIQSLDV